MRRCETLCDRPYANRAYESPDDCFQFQSFNPDQVTHDVEDVPNEDNLPSSELIRQAVETDDWLLTLSNGIDPCKYEGSDDSKDDGESVFLDMRIDVDAFGCTDTMAMKDITATSKLDAKGIVVVLICSTKSKDKWPI
ncbi:MAG: hypothetical protein Q9179_007433 [Wetmoreana sp. 5 TL-2023]